MAFCAGDLKCGIRKSAIFAETVISCLIFFNPHYADTLPRKHELSPSARALVNTALGGKVR